MTVKRKIVRILLSTVCGVVATFISVGCFGQDVINAVSANFHKTYDDIITEKLYLHTDKNFYVAGEVMWFKVYCVNADTHVPLSMSTVAYVELLDSANKAVLQGKIDLSNAAGNGSFYLPVSLNSGNYLLRAYTSWMKNFGSDYFFEQPVSIVNVQKKMASAPTKNSASYHLDFFPEGGSLVANVETVMAFRFTDHYGMGIDSTFAIMDDDDTLLTAKAIHAGLGKFIFTPIPGHHYKAVFTSSSGYNFGQPIATADPTGYALHLTDDAGTLAVTVSSTKADEELYCFVHSGKEIKFGKGQAVQNGVARFSFDKNILNDGISYITIFNAQRQPVSERLYFKMPSTQLQFDIKSDKPVYTTREKISLDIGVTGHSANDSTELSMSIYRIDDLKEYTAPNISSYLFLVSDLKGAVEDPDYYFDDNNPNADGGIDLVMLTHGWRRFDWDKIGKAARPYFRYAPELNGEIITGTITNSVLGTPAPNVDGYAGVPGLHAAFNPSLSDEKGQVNFEVRKYFGPSELVLQAGGGDTSMYRVDLENPFSTSYSGTHLYPLALDESAARELRRKSISMQVQNIYTGKKLQEYFPAQIDSSYFFLNPDASYLLDNYKRFTTLEEVLREYVALVDVRKREGKFHFAVYDYATKLLFRNDPLVLIDGVPVFDFNKFMELDPLVLYKLDVVNRRYFLGSSIFDGILSWTSYKGDMAGYDPGSNATIIDFDGLQHERQFYSPTYDTEAARQNHLPDFRNVLQWNPSIDLEPGHSKHLEFFSSDLPGTYRVQLQGLSRDGVGGSGSYTFTVEK